MDEYYYENLLNIKTTGDQKWNKNNIHYHPYEPTLYSALECLFEKYTFKSNDHVVDFGCGKGRLNFYINYFYKSNVTGIEMNEIFYYEALENKANYMKKNKKSLYKVNFECCLAQDYKIKSYDNKFYFFNPFSVQIFTKVVENILISFEENPRNIEIILYYPSQDYIYYLEYLSPFILSEDIILPKLNKKDERERFVIYKLSY
ncbi:methyltransferase [Clostridium sp. CCUG 7971]|uniref:class I SAM-dependent methyltransferase n=1 Tax=Clostridium sp. CCUG 7971 TaxID=2811414 RepID=UPI001ABA8919|nr:methyltransferase [Clostridium sp. CCUG 7971]MBO3445569.1 methyltransferase [Clostridium sp. CCUG 7971]